LSGSVKGVDYLKLRADGRFELDIYAEITTEDGKKIALAADGVALGEAPVLQLRENVKLTTSHPEHAWGQPDPDLGVRDGQPREGRNPGQGLRGLNMVAKNSISAVLVSTDLETSRGFYEDKVDLKCSPGTIKNHLRHRVWGRTR
jgi:hypothetical protein